MVTKSAEETYLFGQTLADSLISAGKRVHPPRTFCLFGELGSGKTTFVQGFAKGLGIVARLLSPTYIIVRRYQLPQSVSFFYHLDLYRTRTNDELEELGLHELLSDPNSFVVVEWAEKLGDFLPKSRTDINFSVNSDGSHILRVQTVI